MCFSERGINQIFHPVLWVYCARFIIKYPVDFWGWDSISGVIISLSQLLKFKVCGHSNSLTYHNGVGGSGLYGNQDNPMATLFSDSEPQKKTFSTRVLTLIGSTHTIVYNQIAI